MIKQYPDQNTVHDLVMDMIGFDKPSDPNLIEIWELAKPPRLNGGQQVEITEEFLNKFNGLIEKLPQNYFEGPDNGFQYYKDNYII